MVEWKPLNNIVKSISTGLNPRQNFVLNEENASFYYATVKEITTNKIVFSESTDRITEKAKQVINNRSKLSEGDILFSGIGTIGKVAYVDIPTHNWDCSESVFLIKPNDFVVKGKFLAYILSSDIAKNQYEKGAAGAIMKGVRKATLESIQIPIPSLHEQTRIVGILDTFTASIENLKGQIAQRRKQYEHYRDLFFTQLLSCDTCQLNDFCTLITKQTGFDYSSKIKPTLLIKKTNDCIPFIQNKDFEGTRINVETDYYIPLSVAEKFPKILLDSSILLISISGRIGNVGLYDIDTVSFVGGAICVCRLKQGVNGRFILYYLQSNVGQNKLFHSVKAASHANITVEDIRKIQIPVPSLSVQNRIVSILDTFEASIQNLEAQLKLREKQYEYYRNKLLTFE